MNRYLLLTGLLLVASNAALAEAPAREVPPPRFSTEESIEPEVTIIQRDGKTIEEYRVNNQLYMIKVTPKNAPAYYLVDTDGDGSMDSSPSEIEPQLMVPSWMLFRW